MDQISPPMRIVLLVAILFAAAWFTVLKPSDEPAAAPAPAATAVPAAADPDGPTAQTAPGRAAQAARGAAQTQEQSDAATGAASTAAGADTSAASGAGTTSADSGTSAASGAGTASADSGTSAASGAGTASADAGASASAGAATAADAGAGKAAAAAPSPAELVAAKTGLPQRVSGALADRQVVVLLFWQRAGSDDRAVRRAVRGLAVPGKVLVQVAPVAKVSRYAAITQGVDLSRSPSVVVVDRRLKAQLLSGFVARDTIRQAIADARR